MANFGLTALDIAHSGVGLDSAIGGLWKFCCECQIDGAREQMRE